jgi:predicted tellurium resistance membrane protein TerC
MSNLVKTFLVLGAILVVIGISLIIEGQILGDRTIPAAVASTVIGIACILAAIGSKARKASKET